MSLCLQLPTYRIFYILLLFLSSYSQPQRCRPPSVSAALLGSVPPASNSTPTLSFYRPSKAFITAFLWDVFLPKVAIWGPSLHQKPCFRATWAGPRHLRCVAGFWATHLLSVTPLIPTECWQDALVEYFCFSFRSEGHFKRKLQLREWWSHQTIFYIIIDPMASVTCYLSILDISQISLVKR